MKNIIICGASRMGKTLLANHIKKECPSLNLIHIDELRDALTDTFNRDFNSPENFDELNFFIINVYKKYRREWLEGSNKNFLENGYVLIEGTYLKIEDVLKYFDDGSAIIIFVGKPKISETKFFEEIREREKIYDTWTKRLSDDELKFEIKGWLKQAKSDEKLAKKYGFLYLDTTFNQDEVIANFAVKIKEILNT